MSGTGIVRSVGWQELEGRQAFVAVVEYVDGPPSNDDLPFRIVWDEVPVRIVPSPPQSPLKDSEGEGV